MGACEQGCIKAWGHRVMISLWLGSIQAERYLFVVLRKPFFFLENSFLMHTTELAVAHGRRAACGRGPSELEVEVFLTNKFPHA